MRTCSFLSLTESCFPAAKTQNLGFRNFFFFALYVAERTMCDYIEVRPTNHFIALGPLTPHSVSSSADM